MISAVPAGHVRDAFPVMVASMIGGAGKARGKIIGNQGLSQVTKNVGHSYIMGECVHLSLSVSRSLVRRVREEGFCVGTRESCAG